MYIYMFFTFSKGPWPERDPESHFSDLFYICFLLLTKISFNKVSSQPVIEKYFVFVYKHIKYYHYNITVFINLL